MSTFAAYGRLEKAIAAADSASVRQRWEYARRLLVDRVMTTKDGNLRNGVIDKLISAAARQGIGISRREIQYRLQAGRAYPSEAEIAQLVAQYETWKEVIQAGFPVVGMPLGADTEPYDPRTPAEQEADAGRVAGLAGEKDGGQLALFDLFPTDMFDELSTISDLRKYTVQMAEWTERQARRDRERLAEVDRLSAAVGGDESRTLAEAQAALGAQAP